MSMIPNLNPKFQTVRCNFHIDAIKGRLLYGSEEISIETPQGTPCLHSDAIYRSL